MADTPIQSNSPGPAQAVGGEPRGATPADAIPSPEPSQAELRRALDASFLRQFRHLLTGFVLLALWLLMGEAIKMGRGVPHYVVPLGLTTLLLAGLRLLLVCWSPSTVWVHPLGVFVVALLTANGLYIVLHQETQPSAIPLAFVIVVTGSLFLSARWFALTMAGIIGVWVALTLDRIPEGRLDDFASGMFMFVFLSVLLFIYRVRTQTRLESLRLQDDRYKRELRDALNSAHLQLEERERSEAALRESEERYRHVFALATVGIIVHDGERVLLANQEIARLMGAKETEELIGRRLVDFIHPDDRAAATGRIQTHLAHGPATPRGDFRLIGLDGQVRETEITGQSITIGGKPAIQAIVQEVGERRKAERILRQSEERYRLLADNASDGIWTADLNLRFNYFSPAASKLLGLPPEEAIRVPIEKMLPPDSLRLAASALNEELTKARKLGPEYAATRTLELQLIRGDGSLIWTEVRSRILRDADGNPSGVLGVTREITERRLAEEQLRRSEARYRLLAEHATDVIFTTDLHLKVTFLSPAGTRMFGYTPEEAERLTAPELMTPASLNIALGSLHEELARESDPAADPYRSRTMELEFVHKNRETLWTEARVSFIRDGQGGPTGLVGVIRDIRERRRAEAEKQQLEAQLMQSQKLEAIGTLAGGIAHDFNNLLTGILGYASLLKAEAREGDSVYESAEVIETAASRARELTAQLLGFARKGKHQNAAVDLDQTIGEVVALLGRTLNRNIHLIRALHAGGRKILGDPAQMQQVLLNLALNAADAMPEGGTLKFETGTLTPDESFGRSHSDVGAGEYVCVSVSDTGCGIPRDYQDRIFEPFFTTKEQGRGTGMGLAMVYGIVKNHGGFIDVESEVGSGTTFHLYFPAAGEKEASARVAAPGAAVRGKGCVLVVDDEPVVRAMAGDMLKYLGYDVVTANDGREGADYYRAHSGEIDLVIVDMIMPRMGGLECLRALRQINPAVRVLLSTGYGQDSAAQEILDEGAQGFIQKPYQVAQLSEAVARVLGA